MQMWVYHCLGWLGLPESNLAVSKKSWEELLTGLGSTIGWLACTVEQTFLTLYLNRLTLLCFWFWETIKKRNLDLPA